MDNKKDIFKNGRQRFIGGAPEQTKIGTDTRLIHRIILTGNKAVDCVQAAIKFHQDNFIPLRTISLIPSWYDTFFAYMDKNNKKRTGEHLNPEAVLCLFDVDIKKGSKTQKSEMYFEHYFTERGQKESQFGTKIGKA